MEKYKFCRKIKSQKGAISIFTVLAMIFFLMFVLGAFAFATRRNQTQVQSLSDLKSVYKQDANAIYDELAGTLETGQVPIYSEKDFSQIRNGMIRTINGKNYLFSEGASYILKNDIKIDLENTISSSYQPKDYTMYDGKKADNGSDSVNGNGFDVYYMYDSDKDGEDEKYKLIAYSKTGSDQPSNSTRNENKFNIIGDGNNVGSLETINIDAYKYDGNYNFLMAKCEYVGSVLKTNVSPVLVMDNETITGLSEIIDAYISNESIADSDFNTTAEQYFLFIRAQEDAVEVYVEGSLEREIESYDDEEEIAIAIINNTKKSINYTVSPISDEFEISGGISSKVQLEAGKNVRIVLTLKPKSTYYYTNVGYGKSDYTANIKVNIERQYIGGAATNEEDFAIGVNTGMTYNLEKLILAFNKLNTSTPDFKENVTTEASSGMFKTVDESGDTYYFRGVLENNYVSFAGKTWRIIRINGDGSYRIILNSPSGTSAYATTISTDYNNIGYMYSSASNPTANTYSSAIKTYLEDWYTSNLASYDNYISKDAIFWNDRTVYSNSGTYIYYAGWNRIVNNTPSLVASTKADMFSVSTSKGNGKLSKPIGLITADEVVYAGATMTGATLGEYGTYYENTVNYLNLSETAPYGIWTITPRRFVTNEPYNSHIILSKPQASIYSEPSYNDTTRRYVKPVINLKSTVMVKGDGTKDNPYIIKAEK